MIIYLPDPLEIMDAAPFQQTIQIPLPSGGFVNAQPLDFKQARIIGIVSTDPMDYMNEKYQPGAVISL
ncbi:MAG: YlzJ-like family protein [Syntrophomonadaceae bacterium]